MTTIQEKIKKLQRNASKIRNICILAHVDHGKTTLADYLIASNGVISSRSAGKLRYMDSREDEQIRGITMKSSAIALYYKSKFNEEEFIINLIDSPGHVDFSSEVSTAVRLCDGALIVVDVVEGVCPQTQAVLRQAWLERLKPILVFNKMDRLIMELKLSPQEAYIHLQQLLEQVNAVTGSLFSAEVMEKSTRNTNGDNTDNTPDSEMIYDWSAGLELIDDSNLYFLPDQGNVIFASATDGWGFKIEDFAKLYAKKLGIHERVLNKTLWGDYYANVKTKKILKGAQVKGKKTLFAQFILENIWSLYDTVLERRDKERSEKIVKSLNITVPSRDVRLISTDPKSYLRSICSQWLPLANAVLSSVSLHIPSPLCISEERVEGLMCGSAYRFDTFLPETQELKKHFLACDASQAIIVLVSKMIAIDPCNLPQNKQRLLTMEEITQRRDQARQKAQEKVSAKENEETAEDNDIQNGQEVLQRPEQQKFVAFARVFSGTLRKGQSIYVLGPKHDPTKVLSEKNENEVLNNLPDYHHIKRATIGDLYLFMGKEFEELEEVPAGNIVGIAGLEDHILNSATLSATVACPPFNAMSMDTSPIIRVAVEPKLLSQMGQLTEGLKLLNQADPCVRVLVQETGEQVIVTAGEVHLQRCLDDLRQRFAKIEINASSPIVPFRETVIERPKVDMLNELIGTQDKDLMQKYKTKDQEEDISEEHSNTKHKRHKFYERKGCVTVRTPGNECELILRVIPLPDQISRIIEKHTDLIKYLNSIDSSYREERLRRKRTESTGSCLSNESLDNDILLNSKVTKTVKGETSDHTDEVQHKPVKDETLKNLKALQDLIREEFIKSGKRSWADATDNIWAFGPRHCGPNILLNRVKDYNRPSIWSVIESNLDCTKSYRELDNSVSSGFQLASLAGPLCEEPMQGVCFSLEEWNYFDGSVENGEAVFGNDSELAAVNKKDSFSSLSGQLISSMKDACRLGFQNQPQRLMAAMYTCDIQATADVLGKVYAVLGKREGRVIKEEMKEGSDIFNVEATLPVAESFGFTEEIRKRTSGLASPQLMFSHWEVVNSDPFWVPTTEEEIQHFGEKADFQSLGTKYMNAVRRRKGLFVDEKTVEHAEKQRTLTKNK